MFPFLSALAHVPIEGWGDFANGLLHPLVSPAQLLVIAGLALLLGQQVPLKVKMPMLFFGTAAAVSLVMRAAGFFPEIPPPILAVVALGLGALVTLARQPHAHVIHCLCAVVGLILGFDSEVETGTVFTIAQTLTGTWLCLILLTGYVTLASSNAAGKPIAMNAIRILGSWIVAIALLMLAFSLRG
jgi:hydrogenase/urease accessory protein HupE